MTDIASLIMRVDTRQVEKGSTALNGMTQSAYNASRGIKAVETSSKRSAGALSKFTSSLKPAKNATQQLGFQVQDIAVQLQGGTSPFVVMAQQGSQLAGIFGPGGALIGAAIALSSVIGGTLFTAFASADEAADDFNDRLTDVVSGLKRVRLEAAKGDIELLKTAIKETEKEVDRIKSKHISGRFKEQQEKSRAERLKGVNKTLLNQTEALAVLEERLAKISAEKTPEQEEKDKRIENERKVQALILAERERAALSTVDQLKRATLSEKDAIRERFEAQKEAIEEAERLKLDIGMSFDSAILLAEEEKQSKLNEIDRKGNEQRAAQQRKLLESQLAMGSQLAGNLAQVAAAGGEESFKAYKRLAQAQAAISASVAILRALSDGGPFLGPALAVSIGAVAAVQIAQIDQQQYQGARRFGGAVSGGASGSKMLVGEAGPEILSIPAGMNGHVTPNNKIDKGGDNITVVNQFSPAIAATVKGEILKAMPMIINTVQNARGR